NSIVVSPITVTVVSAGIVNGDLLVIGTSGDDSIAVSPDSAAGGLDVGVNGEQDSIDEAGVPGEVPNDRLAGNDTIQLSESTPDIAATVDGGSGFNAFSASFAGDFSTLLQLLELEAADVSIAGDLSGSLTSVEDPAASGSGVISSLFVGGSI